MAPLDEKYAVLQEIGTSSVCVMIVTSYPASQVWTFLETN